MIEITIKKTVSTKYETTESFVVEKTPTAQREQGKYDTEPKVVYAERMEPRIVIKTKETTITLLSQQIEADAEFDLGAVILAINNLPTVPPLHVFSSSLNPWTGPAGVCDSSASNVIQEAYKAQPEGE